MVKALGDDAQCVIHLRPVETIVLLAARLMNRVSVIFLREGVKNTSELADTGEKWHLRLVEVEFIRRSSQNSAEFANELPLRAK